MFKLRYYQENAVDSVFDYFAAKTGNPIIAQPTGTGKSLVIAGLLVKIFRLYPTQRIMMLTHVKKLIEQNFEKLLNQWPTAPAGIYSAGLKRKDVGNKITYAGIQSVAKKAELFGHIDLIVIDECHLVSNNAMTSYRKFIDNLKKVNPHLKVVGLSATPFRLGLGYLTDGAIFTDVCCDDTTMEKFNQFIEEGFLIPLIPRRTETELNTDGVKKAGGEFVLSQLQKAVNDDELTYYAVKEVVDNCGSRTRWLFFGTGIDHCYTIKRFLDQFGISNRVIHSNTAEHPMKDAECDEAINGFLRGEFTVLINNDKLTTGFDCPEIDLMAILRPTHSASLWVQMLGRGTRPLFAEGFDLGTVEGRLAAIAASTKQNCLVFDFAANTLRNGPINDPVIPRKKGSKGGGVAPVRECPECRTWNHASVRVCINCGYQFPKQSKLKAVASSMELIAKQELPQIEPFGITKIIYTRHKKKGKPDSLLVTYYAGLRSFKKFICIEHGGSAGGMAKRWWKERSTAPTPETVDEALKAIDTITVPKSIKVWINTKYPEIMSYEY